MDMSVYESIKRLADAYATRLKQQVDLRIEEMKAEIRAIHSLPLLYLIPTGISEQKKAIAAYMREHPEVTSKSAIAKAVGTDRSTVRKYYNERSGRISFAKRQRDMVCRCLVE